MGNAITIDHAVKDCGFHFSHKITSLKYAWDYVWLTSYLDSCRVVLTVWYWSGQPFWYWNKQHNWLSIIAIMGPCYSKLQVSLMFLLALGFC